MGNLFCLALLILKVLFLLLSLQENKTDVLKQIMFYNVSAYVIKILMGTWNVYKSNKTIDVSITFMQNVY
jgi:hypothetical protein